MVLDSDILFVFLSSINNTSHALPDTAFEILMTSRLKVVLFPIWNYWERKTIKLMKNNQIKKGLVTSLT